MARGCEHTVYRIRARGRQRFQQWLQDQYALPGAVAHPLYPALLFLHLGDLPAIAARLRQRAAAELRALRELAEVKRRFLQGPGLSSGGELLIRHLQRQRRMNRRWLLEAAALVEAGNIHGLPRPPAPARYTEKTR